MSKNRRRIKKTIKKIENLLLELNGEEVLDNNELKKQFNKVFDYVKRFNGDEVGMESKQEVEVVLDTFISKVKKKLSELKLDVCLKDSKTRKEIAKNGVFYVLKKTGLKPLNLNIDKMIEEIIEQREFKKRDIYIHAGPTNSGKTYQAIERMKKKESGIYLSPLRLLAKEIYETLNLSGVPCNLETGDENIKVPFARHTAMTIEKMSLKDKFDIAVIDEAQLFSDKNRGGYWTRALLGVDTKELHICCSLNAVKRLKQLFKTYGERVKVKKYQRKTELKYSKKTVDFPNGLQRGDALIAFSKKDIFKLKNRVELNGLRASILFGEMPPNVRLSEINKFSNRETSVIISTDAIGLGVNVPIKRIIFSEIEKFDGEFNRFLTSQEVKQISGRAGRYGIYQTGEVSATTEEKLKVIQKKNNEKDSQGERLVIFPEIETLSKADYFLKETLEEWLSLSSRSGIFIPGIPMSYQELLPVLKDNIDGFHFLDSKRILWLLNIPFDFQKEELVDLWLELSQLVLNNEEFRIEDRLLNEVSDLQLIFNGIHLNRTYRESKLNDYIEKKVLTLTFYYERLQLYESFIKMRDEERKNLATFYKTEIEKEIINLLL